MPTAPSIDLTESLLLWFVVPFGSCSSALCAKRSSIKDGNVGERSSGMLVMFSEGGSVGESSDGTPPFPPLFPSTFWAGEFGAFALTGDFVRARFSGFGDFSLEETSATSSNARFLSFISLTGEPGLISLLFASPLDVPLILVSVLLDRC